MIHAVPAVLALPPPPPLSSVVYRCPSISDDNDPLSLPSIEVKCPICPPDEYNNPRLQGGVNVSQQSDGTLRLIWVCNHPQRGAIHCGYVNIPPTGVRDATNHVIDDEHIEFAMTSHMRPPMF